MKKKNLYILSCASVILSCTGSLQAKADGDFIDVTSVEANYVGLGLGAVPDYMGSDDYTLGIAPAFRYEFGNHRNVEIISNYASANLLDNDIISFGPALRYRFGRDDDIEDEVVDDMSEIDDTLEAGVRVDAKWILNGNPRNRFILGLDSLWDTGGTSDGYNATASARYWQDVSASIDLGIAGHIFYADDNFNETYFGVDTADSVASGLPAFNAEGGVTSFSIQPMFAFHLSENWHIGGGLRYTKLTGDASDSPIVSDRGDDNQFVAGIGVVYSWGTKIHTR